MKKLKNEKLKKLYKFESKIKSKMNFKKIILYS
jgi:hypothetical protein